MLQECCHIFFPPIVSENIALISFRVNWNSSKCFIAENVLQLISKCVFVKYVNFLQMCSCSFFVWSFKEAFHVVYLIISTWFENNQFTRTGYYYQKPFEYRNIFVWIVWQCWSKTSYLIWTRMILQWLLKREYSLNFCRYKGSGLLWFCGGVIYLKIKTKKWQVIYKISVQSNFHFRILFDPKGSILRGWPGEELNI